MNIYSEKTFFGKGFANQGSCLPHAESNLHDDLSRLRKDFCEVERGSALLDAIGIPMCIEGQLLGAGDARASDPITSYCWLFHGRNPNFAGD
jgi:hypothetical protein